MDRKLIVLLGRVEYQDGLALMKTLAKAGRGPRAGYAPPRARPGDHQGRGANRENVLLGDDELDARGVRSTRRIPRRRRHLPRPRPAGRLPDPRSQHPIARMCASYVATWRVFDPHARSLGRGRRAGSRNGPASGRGGEDPAAARRSRERRAYQALDHYPWLRAQCDAGSLAFENDRPPAGSPSVASLRSRTPGKRVDLDEVATVAGRIFAEVLGWERKSAISILRTVAVGRCCARQLASRRCWCCGGRRRAAASAMITGRIEAGESPAEAAARELMEETGFSVPLHDLAYIHAFGFGDEAALRAGHAFGEWWRLAKRCGSLPGGARLCQVASPFGGPRPPAIRRPAETRLRTTARSRPCSTGENRKRAGLQAGRVFDTRRGGPSS